MNNDTLLKQIAESSEGMMMAAVAAVPVALLVLIVDRIVGKRMAPRYRCWLWLLVAARLLMPVAPGSPFSAQNMWQLLAWESEPTINQVEPLYRQDGTESVAEFMFSDGTIVSQPVAAVAPVAVASVWDWEQIIAWSLLLLWLVGVVFVMLRASVASLRFAWQLRTIPRVNDQAIVDMLLRVCDQLAVGRRPRIKYVPQLSAPALFGLFRPTLCLPEESRSTLDANQLRMILIHEVAHLRRRDAYLAWLLTVVKAIHWFNPIAWFSSKRIEMYREMACDESVRRLTEPSQHRAYAELLLRFASLRPATNLGLIGLSFASPAQSISARIEAFANAKYSERLFPRIAVWALIGTLAVVGLTDAASSSGGNSTTESTSKHQLPVFTVGDAVAWNEIEARAKNPGKVDAEDQVVEREYDVSKALEKLTQANPDVDAKAWLRLYLLPMLVKSKQDSEVKRFEGNVWSLRLTRSEHRYFAGVLKGIAQAGAWQVCTAIRVIHSDHFEALGDIDWDNAVKFALPATTATLEWPKDKEFDGEKGLSLSVDSIAWQYSPYLALVVDKEKMQHFTVCCQSDERTKCSNDLKISMFSGHEVTMRDQSLRPFVVGVQTIRGPYAVAHKPEVAVIPEGTRIDLQPLVIDKDKLDLRCRITTSQIHEEVNTTNLPGMDVAVQTPNASRNVISARCTVSPGQTLLIAAPKGSGEVLYYAVTSQWWPDDAPDFLVKSKP